MLAFRWRKTFHFSEIYITKIEIYSLSISIAWYLIRGATSPGKSRDRNLELIIDTEDILPEYGK